MNKRPFTVLSGAAVLSLVLFSLMVILSGCDKPGPVAADEFNNLEKGGYRLFTTLNGWEEVLSGDFDAEGTAVIWLNQGKGTITFEISASNFYNPLNWPAPATSAHIHAAVAGSTGPVVVTLAPPDETGTSSGTVNVDPALIKSIRTNPSGYYINVHTYSFPAGAIRGQLGD
jgi:hypothetical protein